MFSVMRELVQPPAAPPRQRRTQAERRATTRAALVKATIECLIELGYAGTSTNEVLKRTGISRGALAHHYASKADLLLATMDRLYADFSASILAASASLPSGRRRVRAGIEMLWERFTGPLFVAAMELWVAARTDPELSAALLPHEQRLGGQLRSLTTAVFGAEAAAHPNAETVYQLLLTSMRGQAMTYFLSPGATPSVEHLDNWYRLAEAFDH
jgi:AcrR family transcriptional regulator